MKLLAPLTLLAATVAANPIVSRQDQDGSSSKTFTLKTTNAQNPQHDNLYVWAYHTGAGLNDAVLGDAEKASPGSLNGTNVNFELGSAFPWGMFMPGAANYAAWEPVHINGGAGTKGFSVNDGKLEWDEKMGFGGWLVCDWAHNVPQLFYLYKYMEPSIPSSCSKVELEVEYSS